MSPTEFRPDLQGTGACASFNFRRTARAVTRLFDLAFHGTGIRSTQFAILVGVAKTQPAPIGAVAKLLVIDSTTLTRSLKLLEKDGLLVVSKRAVRRQRFVSLTPRGEQVLADAMPAWQKAQERFTRAIGEDYWAGLRNELERLAQLTVDLEKSATPSVAPY
jgi:DNA-binding MarR family transcriptional regulator